MRKAKSVSQKLKEAEEWIKFLEGELKDVRDDRDKMRSTYVELLRECVRIHGEGKYWSMDSLILFLTKRIGKFQHWWW